MVTRNKQNNRIKKNGFSMVEVLIALLLLSTVGLGYLAVLANSSSHTLNADIRATAESIARSQMESIKNANYEADGSYPEIDLPLGGAWSVDISGVPVPQKIGLQKITVDVHYDGDSVLILEGYKLS